MLKITTVTSTLNVEKDIDQFVKRFKFQKFIRKELIIVDGGSNDTTYKKLKVLKKKYRFLKIFRKNNSSIYEALNYGIKKSTGDIINILGSDDKFLNNKIFKIVERIFNEKKISFLYGNCNFNKNGKIIRVYSNKKFDKKSLKYGFMPAHTTMFVHKKIYKKLNFYSTKSKFASDFDFCFKLFQMKNIKKFYLDLNMVSMRSGGVSNVGIKNIFLSNKEVFNILKKNKINFILIKLVFKIIYKIVDILKFNFLIIIKKRIK